MVDAHYDLLTICYNCYLKNDYSLIESIAQEIKTSGLRCVFANLYFMSEQEMIDEIDPNYYNSDVAIVDMFKISKNILDKYLPDIDIIYSIEGCDYLDIADLDLLVKEGLNSILLVWNCQNKYGSGNRSNMGLTKEGIDFINKAISLGIGIDLSHANEATFYDMIEVIKDNQRQGKEVICYATHSDCRALCDRKRNLDDKQIKILGEVGGLLGLIATRNFVTDNYEISKQQQKEEFLKHVIYAANLIGVDNLMIATDDMRFLIDVDSEYGELSIFDYKNLKEEVSATLATYYSSDDVNKIMFKNAYERIINKLKGETYKERNY